MSRLIRTFRPLLVAWTMTAAPGMAQDHPVFEHLLQVGIPLDADTAIKLPPPSLRSGLDAAEETAILNRVRGRYPLPEFMRNSRVAPFNLQMTSVKNAQQQRTGQTLDLWFVCYGKLALISEHDLIEKFAGLERPASEDGTQDHQLTVQELNARQIQIPEKLDERYYYYQGLLLNRVHVGGVTRTVITRSADQTLIAAVLDERFLGDTQFPNQWQSQGRDEQGRIVLGAVTPYQGYGGYGQATQLQRPEDAILVEFHVAFHEPFGWFDGANLLRSKLPLMVQEKVRDFRSKLANLNK